MEWPEMERHIKLNTKGMSMRELHTTRDRARHGDWPIDQTEYRPKGRETASLALR